MLSMQEWGRAAEALACLRASFNGRQFRPLQARLAPPSFIDRLLADPAIPGNPPGTVPGIYLLKCGITRHGVF